MNDKELKALREDHEAIVSDDEATRDERNLARTTLRLLAEVEDLRAKLEDLKSGAAYLKGFAAGAQQGREDAGRGLATRELDRAEGFAQGVEQSARWLDGGQVLSQQMLEETGGPVDAAAMKTFRFAAERIRALTPDASLCVVSRATVEKVKEALTDLVGAYEDPGMDDPHALVLAAHAALALLEGVK